MFQYVAQDTFFQESVLVEAGLEDEQVKHVVEGISGDSLADGAATLAFNQIDGVFQLI